VLGFEPQGQEFFAKKAIGTIIGYRLKKQDIRRKKGFILHLTSYLLHHFIHLEAKMPSTTAVQQAPSGIQTFMNSTVVSYGLKIV